MTENKQHTLDLYAETLRSTRDYKNLVSLTYVKEPEYEWIYALFNNGVQSRINVSMDSCFAMIHDINRGIKNYIGDDEKKLPEDRFVNKSVQ